MYEHVIIDRGIIIYKLLDGLFLFRKEKYTSITELSAPATPMKTESSSIAPYMPSL